VMFGRNALLVAVPERSQAAAAGSAFTSEYGMTVSTTANSAVRRATPIDYDLGAHSLNEVVPNDIRTCNRGHWDQR